MNPLLYTIPLVAAAYIGASDATDLDNLDKAKQETQQPETDPVSGKVWDRKAAEWVPFPEFMRRVRAGETYRIAEQTPMTPGTHSSGFQVLAQRQEAVIRHREYIQWLRQNQCRGIACPN